MKAHIFKLTVVKFGMRVRNGNSLPQAKFGKNRLRGIPPLGKFIPKITNFGDFGAVSPHFKSDNGEIWREGTDLWPTPRA